MAEFDFAITEEYNAIVLKENTNDDKTESDEETENILLTIGESSVKVNRKKLIQASDYFKALFEGDFADSMEKAVNISKTVTNADILKDVDAFVSRDDISIEPNNIEDLLKLSSYYQFHSLLKKCENYIKDTLLVDTCLSYFILSKAYNLIEANASSSRLLRARFHDYILHQESTLKISPAILADLCDSGYLTFCECFSLLKFISQWVCRGLPKDHITTGLKVLRYIDGTLSGTPLHVSVKIQEVGKILVDLENASKCNEEVSELLRHFEITINTMITEAGRVNFEGMETVLVTVSGRKSAPTKSGPVRAIPFVHGFDNIDYSSKLDEVASRGKNLNNISDDDIDVSEMQVLDICVYEPRCNVWYLLTTLDRDWIKSLPDDFRGSLLKGHFECEVVLFENRVFLVADLKGILSFDLETCIWSGISIRDKSQFPCEMLQEIYETIPSDGHDRSLNVLDEDLYLSYQDLISNTIHVKMFNKETRLFENTRSTCIDSYFDGKSIRNLFLLSLAQLSRKSKRLMPFILKHHDDLEMCFRSCVEDSEQPRIIVSNDLFYECDKENITEDKVHYKINNIGAIDADKRILFVAVEDNTTETTIFETEATGNVKGSTDNTLEVTECGNVVRTTGITTEGTESEIMGTPERITRKNEHEHTIGAIGKATESSAETENFQVIGEYDLETRKLKFRKSFPMKDIREICIHLNASLDHQCSENVRSATFGGQDSFWRIKTVNDGRTCCYSVTSEEFKVTKHVPPPFWNIIAGCETELPRQLLAILKPVHYLP